MSGRALREPALVTHAPAGHGPSGFDPARAVCDACPFADTEISIQAQNWGCLPSPGEVFAIREETGCNWGCHGRDGICAGYVTACRERGLQYRNLPTLDHAVWYQHGQEVAASHAIAIDARSGATVKQGAIRRTKARAEGIAPPSQVLNQDSSNG